MTIALCNWEVEGLHAADLVLDMLAGYPGPGLSAQVLCRAGEVLGLSGQSVRVALTRLVRQKKIAKMTRGYYVLSSDAGVGREFGRWMDAEAMLGPWQHTWLAVHDAHIPSTERVKWRKHGLALRLRGFRPLVHGVFLRPDNLKGGVDRVRNDLYRLGLAENAMVCVLSELDAARERQVLALWDIPALRTQYITLQQRLEQSLDHLPAMPLPAAARESLLLGRGVIRSLLHDPMLPAAWLQGDERHQLFATMHRYQKIARRIWIRLLESERTSVSSDNI